MEHPSYGRGTNDDTEGSLQRPTEVRENGELRGDRCGQEQDGERCRDTCVCDRVRVRDPWPNHPSNSEHRGDGDADSDEEISQEHSSLGEETECGHER
jgi:hypothetical protein